jgi:SAM-dependent methyltransferase
MPTQYDAIGTRYNSMNNLPAIHPERPSAIAALGDISGKRALDLACGIGRYSRLLIELGAVSVVGVDVSPVMIEGAREASKGDSRFEFRVADCSKPLQAWDEKDGPFDVIFAGYLLNYASGEEEMLASWRNIHANLKPGGRFVAITINVMMSMENDIIDFYGFEIRNIGKVKEGWKCRLIADTDPPVEFEFYHLNKEIYEKCTTSAGMTDVTWLRHIVPDDERKGTGFWDRFDKTPTFIICTAIRGE